MEAESLWRLMVDFFYKAKCTNGYSDPNDPNYFSFKKNNYIFRIRRINDHDYRLRVEKHTHKGDSKFYHYCKCIQEIEDTILQYF
jgi:hypothetical protein